MKIALVISQLVVGGSERVLTLMANYWAESGNKVYLITLSKVDTSVYPLSSKVRRLSAQDNMTGSTAIHKILSFRKNLLKLDPSVIISFGDKTNMITCLAALFLDTPLILSERNHPNYYNFKWFYRIAKPILYSFCDCIVVQTQSIKDWFVNRRFSPPLSIIPNPVLFQDDRVMIDSSVELASSSILTVGSLSPQKGHNRLINIFAKVVKLMPDWRLYIAGEGSCRKELESLIISHNLKDSVFLIGQVENPVALLKQADIFVFTSYYEGFPNALCEAMAEGLPVISFDCPSGPSDIIDNGKNGILVPNGDCDTFADELVGLANDPEKRAAIGSEALKIKEKLSIDLIMKQWNDIIKDYE
ncbi:MAG: glycosyltransferase family 4 protein [Desulfobacteraceae bacterium]|nr:glycosyltransferase family 4 protein [Desulfobacteraceae bacterium]